MSTIQIDILTPVYGNSGVENIIRELGPYLQQNGFHVRIVSLMWKGRGEIPDTIEFFPLSDGSEESPFDHFAKNYAEFLQKHGKPDIILATAWPILTFVARLVIQELNHGSCKIISWPHQPIDVYVSDGYGGMECFKLSDAVFVLNRKTYDLILARDHNCNVIQVRNPVNFTKRPLRRRNGRNEKTLLFIGRIASQKRPDIILQAISRTKERWKLIMIGDGDEKNDLPELIDLLHIKDQVELIGWQADPWEYADGISAMVMASDFECLPMTALESLASGIPVISTPVDGIIEIIKPGVNGFLYPFEDINGLTNILDAMSDGTLPEISPEACRASVMPFEQEKVLCDFREKLLMVYHNTYQDRNPNHE